MNKEIKMTKNIIMFLVGTVLLIGLIASTGCATKKYVLEEVAALDQKVEGVEGSVEENQKRIREHDERITSLGSLITQHESELDKQKSEFDSKISEVKRYAQGRLIFQEILKSDEAKFKFDSYELSDEAKGKLDEFVQMLISQDKGVYLEIQGHTDSSGPDSWNLILGKKRAEAVMEYFHKKYRIPLHRMEVISYGSVEPIADNVTREGRIQNRRVVILVYE
jgi:outer membrane protein OmpA-like peptidoglycan-associated protein